MLKKKENGSWYDAPITVQELINELKEYNPNALVKIHMTATNDENTDDKYIIVNRVASGVTGHTFEGESKWNDDEVWIYSKGLI